MSTASNFANDSSSPAEAPTNRFYRTVWRWHFYAGLFVIPFMLMLATTGIIYLFKPQLDGLMYHNQMFVQPAGTMLPYTQQLGATQSIYPDATIAKFTPNVAPNRSTETPPLKSRGFLILTARPYGREIMPSSRLSVFTYSILALRQFN